MLIVDNFGVKYYEGKQHAEHLQAVLKEHYKVKADWTGTRYIGIHMAWDYEKQQVHLFMPNYVKNALKQFQHHLKKKQNQPFPHTPIQYEAKKQYAKKDSAAPPVSATDKNSYKKSAANSCSTGEQSIAQY